MVEDAGADDAAADDGGLDMLFHANSFPLLLVVESARLGRQAPGRAGRIPRTCQPVHDGGPHRRWIEMIVLDRVPRITQAPDAIADLGRIAAAGLPARSCVMLVADPGLRPSGAIERCAAAIRAAGLGLVVVDEVKSDPTIVQVDGAAALARSEGVLAVVALGGGSAMDVGKAVAAIAPAPEGAEYYGLAAHPLPPVPLRKICIPTTAGTGPAGRAPARLVD